MKTQKRQSKITLGKKVASYSALAASFLAMNSGLNGQTAVCSDGATVFGLGKGTAALPPTPDFTTGYFFDIDGDGTDDFFLVNSTAPMNVSIVPLGPSNAVGGTLIGNYNYVSLMPGSASIGTSVMLPKNSEGSLFYGAGYTNSNGLAGASGWLGLRLQLDCDGDGDPSNDSASFAAVQVTMDDTTPGTMTIGDIVYDCSGNPFTIAGVQTHCPAVPTMGEWAQACLALFFLSTGLVYLRREEDSIAFGI